jgi:hypothetical protein
MNRYKSKAKQQTIKLSQHENTNARMWRQATAK